MLVVPITAPKNSASGKPPPPAVTTYARRGGNRRRHEERQVGVQSGLDETPSAIDRSRWSVRHQDGPRFGRADGSATQWVPLAVEVSDDGTTYQHIGLRSEVVQRIGRYRPGGNGMRGIDSKPSSIISLMSSETLVPNHRRAPRTAARQPSIPQAGQPSSRRLNVFGSRAKQQEKLLRRASRARMAALSEGDVHSNPHVLWGSLDSLEVTFAMARKRRRVYGHPRD
jgi:hypothetical protein